MKAKFLMESNGNFIQGNEYDIVDRTSQKPGCGLLLVINHYGNPIWNRADDFEEVPEPIDTRCHIPVKYFDENLTPLDHDRGDWVDVRCSSKVVIIQSINDEEEITTGKEPLVMTPDNQFFIRKGSIAKVYLGFALKLPANHEAIIRPRGSLSKQTGLLFATSGVVDEGYCGPNDQWFVCLYATRDTYVSFDERICQFRIQEKQPSLVFDKVKEMEDPDRGGHGSTGRF